MAMASRYGLMVQNMKVSGNRVKQMVTESWFMQTAMSTRVNGKMIRLTVKEVINMPMVQLM
jgi:hypothetical protein